MIMVVDGGKLRKMRKRVRHQLCRAGKAPEVSFELASAHNAVEVRIRWPHEQEAHTQTIGWNVIAHMSMAQFAAMVIMRWAADRERRRLGAEPYRSTLEFQGF